MALLVKRVNIQTVRIQLREDQGDDVLVPLVTILGKRLGSGCDDLIHLLQVHYRLREVFLITTLPALS